MDSCLEGQDVGQCFLTSASVLGHYRPVGHRQYSVQAAATLGPEKAKFVYYSSKLYRQRENSFISNADILFVCSNRSLAGSGAEVC